MHRLQSSESPYRAVSTGSFGGASAQDASDIQIIDLRTGDVVDEIQVKSGSNQYVSSSISDNRYGDMQKVHNAEAGPVEGWQQHLHFARPAGSSWLFPGRSTAKSHETRRHTLIISVLKFSNR
jgi:hypothetical protein